LCAEELKHFWVERGKTKHSKIIFSTISIHQAERPAKDESLGYRAVKFLPLWSLPDEV
jgi:hypothetical protein